MKINSRLHHLTRHSYIVFSLCFLVAAAIVIFSSPVENTKAEAFDVTATVNAPPPTSPAVITSLSDQQHVNISQVTVSGTCGDGAYVVLYRNGQLSGTAACIAGTFSVQANLSLGANELQAKNYNITDNEGPQSTPIVVHYDIPNPESLPPGASLGLRISSIDGIPYTPGRLYTTSPYPRVQGFAAPLSKITIHFSPSGFTCQVTADSKGQWACVLATGLPAGNHQEITSGVSPQGVTTTLSPFSLAVSPDLQSSNPNVTVSGGLFILYNPAGYRVYTTSELWEGEIAILGGVVPYNLSVEWGDTTTTQYKSNDSRNFTISHTYKKPGVYQPTLRATDQQGNKAFLQLFVTVTDPEIQNLPETSSSPTGILVTAAVGIVVTAIILTEVAIAVGSFVPRPPSPKG
jgi:hypothetical protein